jgi:MHS family alpha-ketoglutarate permease-like MFS transporter
MKALFRNHWRPLVWVILLTAGESAALYTATVTVPFLIRETFFGADGRSGELVATGLVLAALVVLYSALQIREHCGPKATT